MLLSNKRFNEKYNKGDRLTKNYISGLLGKTDSKSDLSFFKCKINCSLCDAVIEDVRNSNNALPLSENRCCNKCNFEKVLPARFTVLSESK